jgi:hypothetical protein
MENFVKLDNRLNILIVFLKYLLKNKIAPK